MSEIFDSPKEIALERHCGDISLLEPVMSVTDPSGDKTSDMLLHVRLVRVLGRNPNGIETKSLSATPRLTAGDHTRRMNRG